jgi:L-lysine exporter family protein LysE/ArgO
MFSIFFEGFVLGLGAALPLGPINILIMNAALKSYKKAVALGFGAMSADISYLLLIVYGVTTYIEGTLFLNILSLFGACFLLYLAFLIFKGRNKHIAKTTSKQVSTLLSSYLKGYILTLLNPYTILFWLSITSYSTTTDSLGLTLFGMITAILLWITIMPYLVYVKRSLIPDSAATKIALVSSLLILFFAVSMFYKGLVGLLM